MLEPQSKFGGDISKERSRKWLRRRRHEGKEATNSRKKEEKRQQSLALIHGGQCHCRVRG
jgi:hypothetical protein